MTNLNSKSGKIESIQSLRAIAFLGILIQHSAMLPLGAWGVSVFIVLSGFIMTYSYYDRRLESSIKCNFLFSIGKIKKLYPLHIIMLFLVVLLLLIKSRFSFSSAFVLKTLKEVGLGVLLLQAWIPNSKYYYLLNGVAWYLCVCVVLYLVFPWVINGLKGKDNKYLYKICIISYMLLVSIALGTTFVNIPTSISDDFSKWVTYICPVFRVGDFFIGCCFGCLYKNSDIQYSEKVATLLEILVFMVIGGCIIIYYMQMKLGNSWFIYSILFTPSSVAMVLLFALNQGIITKLLNNKLMIYIGDISSFGFLIHQVIIKYFDYYCVGFNKYAKIPIILILTLAFSELYKTIETGLKSIKYYKH